MAVKRYLFEFFTDVGSNDIIDLKRAGESIALTDDKAMKLINILVKEQVEFTVYELGERIIDLSYKYYEDYNAS